MRHMADVIAALLAVAACGSLIALAGWLLRPLALMALGVFLTAA